MNLIAPRAELRAALDRVLVVVPAKPLIPAHGQVRIFGRSETSVMIEATNGSTYARSFCDGVRVHPEFDELFPAFKLVEMLKQVAAAQVIIGTTDRSRATLAGVAQPSASFTFPLLADPSLFPAWHPNQLGWASTPVARGVMVGSLAEALTRVGHALGDPASGNASLRLVQLRMGRAVAYNGRRLQEAGFAVGAWNQQGEATPLPVTLPDVALPGLVRFLRSIAGTVRISLTHRAGVRWVAIESDGGNGYYWTHPRVAFTDLSTTMIKATRHRQASARLIVDRATLLGAVRAARIQADPQAPSLTIDLTQTKGAPIRIVAGTNDSNLYELALPTALLVGNEGVHLDAVSYLLEDLQSILEACPDETVHLHIAPRSVVATSGDRQKPMSTLIDSRGAIAVVPQRD